LLDTAITLHQNAVDDYRDQRWWVTPLTAVFTAIFAATGSFVGAKFGAGHLG
jgi:hypothetical protein